MTQIGLEKKNYVSNQAQKIYYFETRLGHLYLRCYTDQYNEDLWLSSLHMYGWTMFTPRIMKEYLHTANTLRAYSEGFEVSDYLVRLFPLAILESLGNGKWQDILQEVLHAINKMRQTAYEGIFKLIIPCILAQNRHSIQLHDKKQFCLV